MVIRARENVVGAWAFLSGIVLAILVGVFASQNINPYLVWVLMALGVVVGYFVAEKDVQTFLFASVSLVVVSYFGVSGFVLNAALTGAQVGKVVSSVLGTLLILFVPATIVVALKTVFSISRVKVQ
ncbi:MAG: hypothetical protein MUF61_02150 [archaeon]|jgi:hypothetical protein|nr:hypothetical protein [archaeon]